MSNSPDSSFFFDKVSNFYANAIYEGGYYRIWEEGVMGCGVSVGLIDSGVTLSPKMWAGWDKYQKMIRRRLENEIDLTGEGLANHATHGTYMAQAILSRAPYAKIVSFKVIRSDGRCSEKWVKEAFKQCLDKYPHVRLINISLGFPSDNCTQFRRCELCNIVEKVVEKGVLVFAAAGNILPGDKGWDKKQNRAGDGTVACPARAKGVLSIGAVGSNAEKEFFDKNPEKLNQAFLKELEEKGLHLGTSLAAAHSTGGITTNGVKPNLLTSKKMLHLEL